MSNRKTVVHGGAVIPHPFSISLFEHHVYFTDWTKMAVMKANKFTDSSPEVIYRTPQTPHGVAVIHQLRQPQGRTPSVAHFCILRVDFTSCHFFFTWISFLQWQTPVLQTEEDVNRSAFWVTEVTMEVLDTAVNAVLVMTYMLMENGVCVSESFMFYHYHY